MATYPNLEEIWRTQSERIEKRSKLSSGQIAVVILVGVILSLILTPIGGFLVAYIVARGMVAAAHTGLTVAKTGTEGYERGGHKQVLDEILGTPLDSLGSWHVARLDAANKALTWLDESLKKRLKDLEQLSRSGGDDDNRVAQQKSRFVSADRELNQLRTHIRGLLADADKSMAGAKAETKR